MDIDQNHFDSFIKNVEFKKALETLEINNPRFSNIPPQQKQLALYLLLNDKLDVIKNLDNLLYKRKVPSIQDFLSEEFLPGHPITKEDNPWRKELINVYSPESSVFEHVLTGAIGVGKTSTAIVSQFYNLFRLTSLRSPQVVMSSSPSKPLCLLGFGVTLSSVVDIKEGFRSLLDSCKYFYRVKKFSEFNDVPEDSGIVPFFEKGDMIYFPNNIKIVLGSQVQHSIGKDIFGVVFDEAEYRLGSNKDSSTGLYLEVFKRVRSRFLGKKFIMINLLCSIKDEHGVIATHIRNGGAGYPYFKVSSMNLWDFQISSGKLDKSILDSAFYVMRGTKTHPSKILDQYEEEKYVSGEFKLPVNCEVLKIPSVFRADFKLNVHQSLRDIAGVATQGDEMPFDDLSGIEDKRLMPIITIDAPLMSNEPLLKKFPQEFIIETPNGYKWRRLPTVKRYVHLDLADSGEAAICVTHKERNKKDNRIMYVVDFLVRILSPDRISLESVQKFVVDLVRVLNMNLEVLTSDQYQSTAMQQYFIKNNIGKNVKLLSVDRNLEPYATLNSIISEKLLRIGTLNTLKPQMEKIYFNNGKPFVRDGRKDLVDALVGSVYNAAMNSVDSPIYYFEEEDENKDLETKLKEEMNQTGFSDWEQ